MDNLISPHGGILLDLYISMEEAREQKARKLPAWDLNSQQQAVVELMLCGALSPLRGFMDRQDYQSVLHTMSLTNGVFFPAPLSLGVTKEFSATIQVGDEIALRDREGNVLAIMQLNDQWLNYDSIEFSQQSAVDQLLNQNAEVLLGGALIGITPPAYFAFPALRISPKQLRKDLLAQGINQVLAYQPNSMIHRLEHAHIQKALDSTHCVLLLQASAGCSSSNLSDLNRYAYIKALDSVLPEFACKTKILQALSIYPGNQDVSQLLLRAIIAQNCGASHFLLTFDQLPTPVVGNALHTLLSQLQVAQTKLDIQLVYASALGYNAVSDSFECLDKNAILQEDCILSTVSASTILARAQHSHTINPLVSFPAVLGVLDHLYPKKQQQGLTIFFTGLSGSGKSTVAKHVMSLILSKTGRKVSLLDGDVVRKHLSSELGFSKEHRNLNILRIGYLASKISRHGGIAICAPIAPYAETRAKVRAMVEVESGFIEVHIAASVETCEARDTKGLYAKARSGIIKEFTGISDPYEVPESPEISIDTATCTPEQAAQQVMAVVQNLGYLPK